MTDPEDTDVNIPHDDSSPEQAPIVDDGDDENTDEDASDRSTSTSSPTITTKYDLNEEGRVSKVEFENNVGYKATATIREDDPAYYDYSSDQLDDKGDVAAPLPMSLADVILAANVDLGLIPPHNFDSIPCRNKH